MEVWFVCGHLDLKEDEFLAHYKPRLDALLERVKLGEQLRFVMGNARGADTMALQYLLQHSITMCPQNICVHVLGWKDGEQNLREERRLTALGVQVHLYGTTDPEFRDANMTLLSTHDLAWVRSPATTKRLLGNKYDPNRISGTQQNINRRSSAFNHHDNVMSSVSRSGIAMSSNGITTKEMWWWVEEEASVAEQQLFYNMALECEQINIPRFKSRSCKQLCERFCELRSRGGWLRQVYEYVRCHYNPHSLSLGQTVLLHQLDEKDVAKTMFGKLMAIHPSPGCVLYCIEYLNNNNNDNASRVVFPSDKCKLGHFQQKVIGTGTGTNIIWLYEQTHRFAQIKQHLHTCTHLQPHHLWDVVAMYAA